MIDAALATAAALLIAVAALVSLGLLLLAPGLVTAALAERRGWGSVRWPLAAGLGSVAGLALVLVGLRTGSAPTAGGGLVVAWLVPGLARVLPARPGRLVGARGRHE